MDEAGFNFSSGEFEFNPRLSEDQLVENWRIEQLLRLGFSNEQVVHLFLADVDLSVARNLVGRGCPLELAERILI